MRPINVLNERVDQVIDRISDAEYIFNRKFQLVDDQILFIKEKIEQDKKNNQELDLLRK